MLRGCTRPANDSVHGEPKWSASLVSSARQAAPTVPPTQGMKQAVPLARTLTATPARTARMSYIAGAIRLPVPSVSSTQLEALGGSTCNAIILMQIRHEEQLSANAAHALMFKDRADHEEVLRAPLHRFGATTFPTIPTIAITSSIAEANADEAYDKPNVDDADEAGEDDDPASAGNEDHVSVKFHSWRLQLTSINAQAFQGAS